MKIQVTAEACTGCRLCRQVCAIEKFSDTNPRRARLLVQAKFPAPGRYYPIVCDQCGECADVCPTAAILQDERDVYYVNEEDCTLCGVCVDACPLQVMMRPGDEAPYKCDFCWRCTEVCNTGALVRVD